MSRFSTFHRWRMFLGAIALGLSSLIGSPARGEYSLLSDFTGKVSGTPRIEYVDAQGDVYASSATQLPGYEQYKVSFFEYQKKSGLILPLGSISQYKESVYPGMVVDAQGNLFAAARSGSGAFGDESLIEIKRGSGMVSTVSGYNFPLGNQVVTGLGVQQLAINSSGDVFGTSRYGTASRGSSAGTLFELKHGSNALTLLSSFDGSNGAFPSNNIIVDPRGNVYGTTSFGGTVDKGAVSGNGTVFKWNAATGALTTPALINPNLGSLNSLAVDPTGNLFALSGGGGTGGVGLLVELKQGANQFNTVLDLGTAGNGLASIVSVDKNGTINGKTADGSAVSINAATGLMATTVTAVSKSTTSADGVSPTAEPRGKGSLNTGRTPGVAPEIDPTAGVAGLTLFLGGFLIVTDTIARRGQRIGVQ